MSVYGLAWGMEIQPIGVMRSCFGEKFATPRQPGLCPSAWGRIHFHEPFRGEEFLRGIEGFSHVWVIFGFHETQDKGWSPTVRPPRLGGNQRVGVWASRSTFRPNGLGLSLCRIEGVESSAEGPVLLLGGVDCIDGTPVYDLKPYLAYAESVPDARCGYALDAPPAMPVSVADAAGEDFAKLSARDQSIIREALAQDPRPAVHDDGARVYGARLCGVNVRFCVDGQVTILEIAPG
jgi:tRNA-Thr(GGU) m(6)t(6)A37 methyltransferase TsaA